MVPRWHEHWTSNKVYDGDMIVLQGQEKIFLSKIMEGSADVNKEYTKITFTPTQADRFVLAFRNWLRRHGNSQPEWFGLSNQKPLIPLQSTVLSKRQVGKVIFIFHSHFKISCHLPGTKISSLSLSSQGKINQQRQYRPAIWLLRLGQYYI